MVMQQESRAAVSPWDTEDDSWDGILDEAEQAELTELLRNPHEPEPEAAAGAEAVPATRNVEGREAQDEGVQPWWARQQVEGDSRAPARYPLSAATLPW